jgi:cytochrome c-type biogenesis protein CcmH/NrfG
LALRLVRQYPRNLDAWLTIGENFAKTNDRDKAKAAFRKVLEIEPGNTTANGWLKWLQQESAQQ